MALSASILYLSVNAQERKLKETLSIYNTTACYLPKDIVWHDRNLQNSSYNTPHGESVLPTPACKVKTELLVSNSSCVYKM